MINNILHIYTDGGCRMKHNIGAWAYVVIDDKQIKENCGYTYGTTNNRMELQAVIEALKSIKEGNEVSITTDSQYIYNAFMKDWIVRWKANKWFTNKGPVKNKDLWLELDSLVGKFIVHWYWVKGHTGNNYNEMVDKLATNIMKSQLGEL
jgi:ribonuclease HI